MKLFLSVAERDMKFSTFGPNLNNFKKLGSILNSVSINIMKPVTVPDGFNSLPSFLIYELILRLLFGPCQV